MPKIQEHRRTLRDLRTGWRDPLDADRRMTQMDLAVRLGVSLSTVTNLESGRHQPRMELARKIADLFGVTIDSIEWPKVARPKKAATTAANG